MNLSVKVRQSHKVRRDATSLIYLQVIINRKVIVIQLGLGWPPEKFDKEKKYCLARFPKDGEANDHNLVINKALGRVNDIFIQARLGQLEISGDNFLREYNQAASKKDFIEYFTMRRMERYNKGEIKTRTYLNHGSTLEKLREFRPILPFNHLNNRFPQEFTNWLKKKHGSETNTIWGRHRDLKAYLNLASQDNIKFDDPYKNYKNKSVAGKWQPLTLTEVAVLEAHYETLVPGSTIRRILQKFLFSCWASLRISDLNALSDAPIINGIEYIARVENGVLIFKPIKTYWKNEKELRLPLLNKAKKYLNDSQEENGIFGFVNYVEQYCNRQLQALGLKLGIQKKLHFHVGRETFATNFIVMGGRVEILQKYMDHEKITTTMKYVQLGEAMKASEILKINDHLNLAKDPVLVGVPNTEKTGFHPA